MDFHLRLRNRFGVLSLFFLGLLILLSVEGVWYLNLDLLQAIQLAFPKAAGITFSFWVCLKALDWLTPNESSEKGRENDSV